MTRRRLGGRNGRSICKKVLLAIVLLSIWLVPSYELFTGSFELNPRGNLEVSMLIGWAFVVASVDLASLMLLQFEELKKRLRSLL